jgi:anti-sigma factor RsiW
MIEQPEYFDLSGALGRYARGELSATQIDELTRRVNDDPELRSAWTEYQISRYIDGELSTEEIESLTTTVQEDPELTAAMAEYKALDEKLSNLTDDVPEFDFVAQRQGIRTAIEARQTKRGQRFHRWLLRPALAALAAAAVFVLALGVYLMIQSQKPTPQGQFQVSVVPPAEAPAVSGEVQVSVRPGESTDEAKSSGSVVAMTGGPTPPTMAQGVSNYMMFACCAGMPPSPTPSGNLSPIYQAMACLSWFLEQQQMNQ